MKTLKFGDIIQVFEQDTEIEYIITAVYSGFAVGENKNIGKHIAYHLHYSDNKAVLLTGDDGNKHIVKNRYPRVRF